MIKTSTNQIVLNCNLYQLKIWCVPSQFLQLGIMMVLNAGVLYRISTDTIGHNISTTI